MDTISLQSYLKTTVGNRVLPHLIKRGFSISEVGDTLPCFLCNMKVIQWRY